MDTLHTRALKLLRTGLQDPTADFRDGQWEAIEALVARRERLLLVQRTGWGKSVVYFIASRLLREQNGNKGLSLLISPLLSLMRNQVEMAQRMGIRARTIHSGNTHEWESVQAQLLADEVDLLLISPERLANAEFSGGILQQLAPRILMFIVDEAHCISDWGHDFRPDYRRIVRVLRLLPGNVPVLATTATANQRVVEDIHQQLGGRLTIQRGSLEGCIHFANKHKWRCCCVRTQEATLCSLCRLRNMCGWFNGFRRKVSLWKRCCRLICTCCCWKQRGRWGCLRNGWSSCWDAVDNWRCGWRDGATPACSSPPGMTRNTPPVLRKKLNHQAPVLLYGFGNPILQQQGGLAIVGSRHASDSLVEVARRLANGCAREGWTVISGGAKGVDRAAMLGAPEEGGTCVGVLAADLARIAASPSLRDYLLGDKLCLISPYHPKSGFTVGNAMGRNKVIYALAEFALVMACEEGRGGT